MILRILQHHFYLIQIGFGVLALGIAWWLLGPKAPESGFRVREADLEKERKAKERAGPRPSPADAQRLARAKMSRAGEPGAREPLRLTGIRLDGTAHEILGIREDADRAEIQAAYRERMKQYHPDRVGRPGTREWQDAQKIAEVINRAKDQLLKKS